MGTKTMILAIMVMSLFSCNSGKKSQPEISTESSVTSSESTSFTSETTSEIPNIENIQWKLVVLEDHEVHNLDGSEPAIHFILKSEGNRVNRFSGCNTFFGTYKLDKGNQIKFSQMASTKKACPVAAIKEAELLNIFEMADHFTLKDNKLMLNMAKNATLAVFETDHLD